MLICRAAKAALSANFDPLIENWAQDHKIAMRGALDGVEAVNFQFTSSPLIKFHGCLLRGREETIWTAAQFGEAVLNQRKQTCSDWMNLNLPGKHLVVVGFWSDWGYLNDVLADAFSIATAASVTVVSPGDSASLEIKAPLLWGKANQKGAGRFGPDSDLKRWGVMLASRGGKNAKKRAITAVARKLAVLLHHLWVTGDVYQPLYKTTVCCASS